MSQDSMTSFENPVEEGLDIVTDEFIEIETPDFDKTYQTIKSIIYDGFVPVKLEFGDSNLLVKNIFESEFKYIDLLTSNPQEKLPLYFLYSMVLFDGREMIQDRKRYHHEIQEVFRSFPFKVQEKISNVINSVQNYHYGSFENLEGYLYEKESRIYWNIYKQKGLNLLFPQFNTLGYNTAQETWVIYNQREDDRVRDENEYNIAKFIVSGFVGGKEIKKINIQEKLRWQEEMKRRQDVRLKNKVDRIRLSGPTNTADELVKELERQIKGEKDQHDKIIERHEKILQDETEERRRNLEIMRLNNQEKNKETPYGLSGGSKSISKEESEKLSQEVKKPMKLDPKLFEYENMEKYTSKLSQMKPSEKKEIKAHKKESIFDPQIQEELQKLKKLK